MTLSMTVLTDGRMRYIEKALPTWINQYDDQIKDKFIIDDSGEEEYRDWLTKTFPSFTVIPVSQSRSGYTIGMRKMLSIAADYSFNLHIEDDFLLLKPANLNDMVSVLEDNPRVSQMSLMRKPWYQNEIEHGGVAEAIEAQGERDFNQRWNNGTPWVKHSSYFTTNPSVFPSWVAKRRWPDNPWSEMKFGQALEADKKVSGILGHRQDWIYVEHIGTERNGENY